MISYFDVSWKVMILTFALGTKTDKNGTARIKLLEKGNWLVNVMYEVPYPDKEECDNYRYNYSFTFVIQ